MSTVAFRVDIGPTVGVGHLVRCFALAQVIHELNHTCHFWLTQYTPFVEQLFAGYPFSIAEVGLVDETSDAEFCLQQMHAHQVDTIVLDHYGLGPVWQRQVRQHGRLGVLEDRPNREYCVDWLVDPTPQRQSHEYTQRFVQQSQPKEKQKTKEQAQTPKLFLSADYVLVRAGFRQLQQASQQNKKSSYAKQAFLPRTVLIAFGGSDVHGYSQQVIHTLREAGFAGALHVVTTSLNPLLASLQQVADAHGAQVWVDVSDMGQLMANADLMIGALGSTSWERAVLGLPALSLQVADNQNDVANFFAAIEQNWVTRSVESLMIQLRHWLDQGISSEQMHKRHKALMQVCDGLGAYRVALRALRLSYDIQLQPMTLDDMDLLYQWQCEPNARRFSRQPNPPRYADHVQWFTASIGNPQRRMWLIKLGALVCGYVRLDVLADGANGEEISILISQPLSGMGIAQNTLEAVKSLSKFGRIHAHVQTENGASQKAFLASGYERIEPTEYQWIAGTEYVE